MLLYQFVEEGESVLQIARRLGRAEQPYCGRNTRGSLPKLLLQVSVAFDRFGQISSSSMGLQVVHRE